MTSLLSVLLVASPALLSVPGGSVPHSASCGEWRWDVKTLSDSNRRDVDFNPRRTTTRRLRRVDSPEPYDGMPRAGPVEKQVYRVRAQVLKATIEEDSDVHLVIASPKA